MSGVSKKVSKWLNRGAVAMVIALSITVISPASHSIEFSKTEKLALKKGETVRKLFADNGKDGFYGGSGWAMINAPVEEVWANVLDWKSYTKIFEFNVETKELYRHKGRSVVRMKLGHPIINVQYTVEMKPDKVKNTMRFRLLTDMPSDLDHIKGYWQFFPQAGGKTLVVYVIGLRVPPGMEALLPDSFKRKAIQDILNIPGILKQWIEKKNEPIIQTAAMVARPQQRVARSQQRVARPQQRVARPQQMVESGADNN